MMKTICLVGLLLAIATGCATQPVADVSGSWTIYYYAYPKAWDDMSIDQQGNLLQGTWHSPYVEAPVKVTGSVTGNTIHLDVPIPAFLCQIDAVVSHDGQEITNGTWTVSGGPLKGTHPWRAVKKQSSASGCAGENKVD